MRIGIGGTTWADQTYIESYMQFENSNDPGEYTSFTCGAEYNRYQGYSRRKEVRSYSGDV